MGYSPWGLKESDTTERFQFQLIHVMVSGENPEPPWTFFPGHPPLLPFVPSLSKADLEDHLGAGRGLLLTKRPLTLTKVTAPRPASRLSQSSPCS